MAEVFWNSKASGDWSTAADWSGGAVPGASDDVTIAVAGITVTLSTGTLAANSITTTSSAVSVTGATLTVGSYINTDGAWQQSGGSVTDDNSATFGGTYQQTNGSMAILGNAAFNDGYTQSGGTLSAGNLNTLNGVWQQTAGTVSVSNSGSFGALFKLGGGSFVNDGSLLFSDGYTQTGGTLTSYGSTTFDGSVTDSAGVLLLEGNNSTINGGVTLNGGTIENLGSVFTSFGTFTETKGTLALAGIGAQFNANLVQTGGTIDLLSGSLGVAGAVTTLDGTVTGNGTLVIEGQQDGNNGTTTIGKTAVLSIGKLVLSSGELALSGNFAYSGYYTGLNNSILALNGHTLTLSGGAELGGQISGGGTITASNGAQLDGLTLNNSAVLNITSAVTVVPYQDQPGFVTLENTSKIVIAEGASLRLTGDDQINDTSYNGTLLDNGLLNVASGLGVAEILSSFDQGVTKVGTASVTGSIYIGAGALDLSGASNTLNGADISGPGTLSLGNVYTGEPTAFNLAAGTLSVGSLALEGRTTQDQLNILGSLNYAGNWDQSGGLLLFSGPGTNPTLRLTGSAIFDGGVIKTNTGTIVTNGLVDIGNNQNYQLGIDIEGFTKFVVNDRVTQNASMQFGVQSGSLPTATISSTGTWLLQDSASITGPYGKISNSGTLEKNIGSGVSSIDGTLLNLNAGLLDVAASQVLLDGSGTLDGKVAGAGQLDFEGNGIYNLGGTLANGSVSLMLTVGHVLVDNTPFGQNASVVNLQANLSYAGDWAQHGGTVQLNTDTLTLSSTAALDGGVLVGTSPNGTLLAEGMTTLGGSGNSIFDLGSYAELDITKTAEQSTTISFSSLGTLLVSSGATYTLDAGAYMLGNGTLDMDGTMVLNGQGYTEIDDNVVSAGQITATAGTLNFMGSVSGGNITIDNGAQLQLNNAVSNLTTITMSATNADLLIGDAPAFQGLVNDFVSTDYIELKQLSSGAISDSLSNGGKLLTISDSSNHTFTVAFSNAQTLSSLEISDGPNGYIGIYHL